MKVQKTGHLQNKAEQNTRPLWLRVFEQALLALVLAAAVLRVTVIETPHVDPTARTSALSNEAVSLLMSSVFWAAAVLWVMLSAMAGRLRWRPTSIAGAVALFGVVGLAGVAFASDKRAALTDWAVMLSGPAAGLLAMQLFSSRQSVRQFLWLLLAVGAASTYACYDKITSSHEMLIREYERNPDSFLDALGIEPGSLSHWQYEHRLYSRDVSGFLTTSNSTGSFLLLAVFAGLGLCMESWQALRRRKRDDSRCREETLVALVCTAAATALSLAGLLMTQSKGANGAFIVFALALPACLLFRKTLWTYRRALAISLIVAGLSAAAAMILYGIRHGRLPGGNSMLVRWQYWAASVQMAKESPLLGVGGGNYAAHYLTHKIPAAPETIGDPHNWVFSLLCRYGLIGLAAMGCALLRPVIKLFAAGLSFNPTEAAGQTRQDSGRETVYSKKEWTERSEWLMWLAATMAAMLLIRPVLLELNTARASAAEWSAAVLLLVVIPAGIIALVFGLLRFACAGDISLNQPNVALFLAIACGLAAVLLHNLVDFALFEPGVWTMFWLTAAAGGALYHIHTDGDALRVYPLTGRLRRGGALLAAAALFSAFVWQVVAPPIQRDKLTFEAARAFNAEQAQAHINHAVAVDPLSPEAARFGARLLLHRSTERLSSNKENLLHAAQHLAEMAIARNLADARPRQLLADILLAAAEQTDEDAEKTTRKQQAFKVFQDALERYPGSDVLNYQLGVLAEELGRPEQAVSYLEAALDIEQRYRQQFQIMYPDQPEIISRLGPRRYEDLLERLSRLRSDRP